MRFDLCKLPRHKNPREENIINPATLNTVAQELAETLLSFFPSLELTSGIRSRQTQASAMASNCILNPKWISATYAPSDCATACQTAVDSVYGLVAAVISQSNLTAALVGVLSVFGNDDLRKLSWHLSGDAFDVQPVDGDEGAGIKDKIRSLVGERIANGGRGKFLETEGGLVRWHVQIV